MEIQASKIKTTISTTNPKFNRPMGPKPTKPLQRKRTERRKYDDM
jgi:hypothetical protein